MNKTTFECGSKEKGRYNIEVEDDEILKLEVHFEKDAILNLFTERIMQEFEAQKDKLGSKKAVSVTVFMGKEKAGISFLLKPDDKGLVSTRANVESIAFAIGRTMALKFIRSLMFVFTDVPMSYGEYVDGLKKKVEELEKVLETNG